MSDQKHAEVEEIVAVSQRVRGTADFMAEAASYAAESDPDPYMWGVVGLPFGQAYEMATIAVHATFMRIPDAILGLSDRLEDAAKSISDNDDEVGRSFDDLNSADEG